MNRSRVMASVINGSSEEPKVLPSSYVMIFLPVITVYRKGISCRSKKKARRKEFSVSQDLGKSDRYYIFSLVAQLDIIS